MRRNIIVLITLLLMVLPVAAQEWPDSFLGDQMHFDDPAPIQMFMLSWHDRNPWGMVDMTGHFFYFGEVEFGYCEGVNVAFLDFDKMAMRNCPEPVFGTPAPSQCYYYSPRSINLHYILTWNEDAGAYLVLGDGYWGTSVIALSLNGDDSAFLFMGTMNLDQGIMIWDDTFTHYTYVIEEKSAEPIAFLRRGAVRRLQ